MGATVDSAMILFLLLQNGVRDKASINGQTVEMQDRADLHSQVRYFQTDEIPQLSIAILLDDVDMVMLLDKFTQILGEGDCLDAHVACRFVGGFELVARLGYSKMRRAYCYDADFGILVYINVRLWHILASGLEFLVQPVHQVLVIFRPFGISGFFIVPAAP